MRKSLSPLESAGPGFAHFWQGSLQVAFVFSAPGTWEAHQLKPVFDVTGKHLDMALGCHLTQALPSVFASCDRYDYRITNASAIPVSLALGHGKTEAARSEVMKEANRDRVRAELVGCQLVVLCGKRAHLLEKHLTGFPLVLVGHISMSGLNMGWSHDSQLALDPDWSEKTGKQRTAVRIAHWARNVEDQVRVLLDGGQLAALNQNRS
jgi:hypothetical protein